MRIPTVSSIDEFVRWEERQQERYEFARGAISLLPGALRRHEIILINLTSALRAKLGAGPVAGSGLKLVTENSIRYPDVLVGFDARDAADAPHMRYPTLLIEIMATSTSAIDRGAKVDEYCAIETLQEYVLIDSQKCWVQALRRAGSDWVVSLPVTQGSVTFESVQLEMSIGDIYAGAGIESR